MAFFFVLNTICSFAAFLAAVFLYAKIRKTELENVVIHIPKGKKSTSPSRSKKVAHDSESENVENQEVFNIGGVEVPSSVLDAAFERFMVSEDES